jgi:hypothetical protein
MSVSCKVTLDLTRESVVSILAGYADTALPSAMLNILAEALERSGRNMAANRDERDVQWVQTVVAELRKDVEALRSDEAAIYAREEV